MSEAKPDIDLNLFVVFDEVYRHRSVSHAARVLHVSQPAVSHALARLRETLADPLFVRRGNTMVPTPMARTMLATVQRALRLLRDAVRAARTFEPERAECEFRLGFRDALESLAFPALMADLAERAPGIRISSQRVATDAVESALTAGRLDLVVDVGGPVGDHICHQRVCLEPLAVVVRRGHPRMATSCTIEEYVAARHVLVTLIAEGPELVDLELDKIALARTIVLRCQHYLAACQVVAATDMVVTMPRSHAAVLAEHLPLTLFPLPIAIPPLDIRLFWHRDTDLEPANQWLRQTISKVIEQHIRTA
ncbi:MAG: LysR family transcriptional regulator [Proteobacteria bacterium]|nr:LysR family transcriptional regulator [Pseudomonadota bacterium]